MAEEFKEGDWVWIWCNKEYAPRYSLILKVHEKTSISFDDNKILLKTYEVLFGEIVKRVLKHELHVNHEDCSEFAKYKSIRSTTSISNRIVEIQQMPPGALPFYLDNCINKKA